MKPGVPISVVGHVVAVVAGVIAIPYGCMQGVSSEPLPNIPIELVTLSAETNIRAAVEEDEPEPAPVEPAREEEQPEPPAQEQVAPTPPPPPPPEPEPVPAPEPAPEPEPEPEPEPARPQRPAPPAPPREEEPEEDFSLDDIANLVDRAREETRPQNPRDSDTPPETAERARQSVGLGSQMTVADLDAIRLRINQCWRNSADAPNPEDLVVMVRVRLNRDGSLAAPPQVQNDAQIALSRDPYLRIARDRAVRAVNECAPYDFLSPERYDSWREFTLRFDSVIR